MVHLDGTEGQIDFVENNGWLGTHLTVYITSHLTSRGDVVLRNGFADGDHTIFWADEVVVEVYRGFRSHDNMARGGSAGILFWKQISGILEDVIVEDNFVSGEPTTYGHGHGAGGIWITDGPSVFLRNCILRRNSVSLNRLSFLHPAILATLVSLPLTPQP